MIYVCSASSQGIEADLEFLAALQSATWASSQNNSSNSAAASDSSIFDFGTFTSSVAAILTPSKTVENSISSVIMSGGRSGGSPSQNSRLSSAAAVFLQSLPDLSYMLSLPGDADAKE